MKRALILAATLAACRGSSSAPTVPDVVSDVRDASVDAPALPAALDASARAASDATAPAERAELARLCSFYACTAEPDRLRVGAAVLDWDDGKTKTTAERIDHPDVEDVFALRYPAPGTLIAAITDAEIDPGRVRIDALFRATYGEDARAVSAALVPVTFAGHRVSFHRVAAPALERVAKRVDGLLARDPSLARFFANLGGTFNPRNIAGTDHASAHSWGIAIDIDPSHANYWRNMPPPPRWQNRVPQVIVDAFEAEAFVWGGRWFHYDTMHFEYRPELFLAAPTAASSSSSKPPAAANPSSPSPSPAP